MTYSGKLPFKRLVYPVAQAGGLGIHLTLDMAGQARFGPDVAWIDSPDYRFVQEQELAARFAQSIQLYWPGLDPARLGPGYVGVRPKASAPGEPAADFIIRHEAAQGFPGLVQLFGIESPGLTSSLAIGDNVLALLQH
jgi:L-2-hydroxyglutarate oxidase LhgO